MVWIGAFTFVTKLPELPKRQQMGCLRVDFKEQLF